MQVRGQVLPADDLQWKDMGRGWLFFEQQVVSQLADADESLAFGVLVNKKINDPPVEVMKIFFQKIIRYQPDTVFAMLLQ